MIKKSREDGDLIPHWGVQFEDGTTDEKTSSRELKLVRDGRIFQWTTVEDSVPECVLQRCQRVGIANFEFEESFADPDSRISEPGCDHPFLMLLIHLWPGDWRKHLQRLNEAIEASNSEITGAARTKDKKRDPLVSGASTCCFRASLVFVFL